MAGTLYVVATPIGNLEDITLRALRVLREVAVIAAEDTRRTAHLLARHAIATPTTSLHEHNEVRKTPSLIARLHAGENVALVSDAGTPTISDPGRHLIRTALAAGIRVEPIPGPSAVMAALSASGVDADTFLFLGFPPIRSSDRKKWFERVHQADIPIVFFEAPHRIRQTLSDLQSTVGDVAICVARELTKAHEESVIGPINSVLNQLGSDRGEFVVVVDKGRSPNNVSRDVPAGDQMLTELGRLIENSGLTRRMAIAQIAQRYGLTTNAVYRAVEAAKQSGK